MPILARKLFNDFDSAIVSFEDKDPTILPSNQTSPLSGGVSQFTALNRELFPHPLGPIINITSPFDTLKETLFNAVISPNFLKICHPN